MKKIIILFTSIFCLNTLTFAQDLYAGFKAGLKLEYFKRPLEKNSVASNYHFDDRPVLVSAIDFSSPTLQAVFRTSFFSNWEVEAGIGWYNYSQKLKAKIRPDCANNTFGVENNKYVLSTSSVLGLVIQKPPVKSDGKYVLSTSNQPIYGCIFFTPKAGYRFPINHNLHLRLNTGMQIGFVYNARSTANTVVDADPFELFVAYRGVKKPNINLLVSNTISLQYVTKPNIYFAFFASYHIGLLNVYQSDVYIVNRRSNEIYYYSGHDEYINSSVTTKGSYFEFGVELGYQLKRE